MERVTAVALAHDQLTGKGGQTHVNAATYLGAPCEAVERTQSEGVRIERNLEPVMIRPDRAVPLGLILNELLTNAVKYAVQERLDAMVSVQFLSDIGTGDAMLVVRDNGPGFGEPRSEAQGLRIVRMLSGQLSGRVDMGSSASGTEVRLILPLVE